MFLFNAALGLFLQCTLFTTVQVKHGKLGMGMGEGRGWREKRIYIIMSIKINTDSKIYKERETNII